MADNMEANIVLDGLFGLCVGDALGVPVEFREREYLRQNPVSKMSGFGTYNQPPGTWSDDSSLAFCLADSLCSGFDLEDIGKKFILWFDEAFWTPHRDVFDIGNATRGALKRIKNGVPAVEAGGTGEHSNGNGSLMRILPLVYHVRDMDLHQRVPLIEDVSAITHGHKRSKIACVIYLEMAINILKGMELEAAYEDMKRTITRLYSGEEELKRFGRLLEDDISRFCEKDIASSGYVVHTLEAALWCLLTGKRFSSTVLKAVNLGGDTDTTGAVAGGLAGLFYGYSSIPGSWIKKIARKDDITELANSLFESMDGK